MKSKEKLTKFAAFLITLSLSFSACSDSSEEVVSSIKETISEFIEPIEDNETIEDENIITDELSLKYLEYYKNLEFPYNNEELYITDEEINNIIESASTAEICTYEFEGDFEGLISCIEDNTNNFILENPEYSNFLSNDQYKKILRRILAKLYINGTNNKKEDLHRISTISIVFGSTSQLSSKEGTDGLYLAYYDDELNVIVLNEEYIRLVAQDKIVSFEYNLSYVLEHELNHVRQSNCDCRVSNYNDIAYNEYVSFIIESTAESSIYNQGNSVMNINNYSYEEERIHESEILLLGLLTNKSIDEYYNAVYDNDLNKLFHFLNLDENEIDDFYKILYSIDGMLCRNDLPYDILDDVEGITYKEIKDAIGFSYKENLFKILITKLITYTTINDISLEENLVLYNFMRNTVINGCYSYDDINDTIVRVYDKETINNIYLMDEQYISFLSEKYKITKEEIREIERIDIYITMITIRNIVEGEESYDSYLKEASTMLEKYPLLANIIKNDPYMNFSNYSSYLEDNDIKIYERSY